MRIKITSGGIFGASGEVPVGSEFDLQGPLPEAWAGRYVVLSDKSSDSTAVTNPAITRESIETMERADVLAALEEKKWDGDKRLGVEKLRTELAELLYPSK